MRKKLQAELVSGITETVQDWLHSDAITERVRKTIANEIKGSTAALNLRHDGEITLFIGDRSDFDREIIEIPLEIWMDKCFPVQGAMKEDMAEQIKVADVLIAKLTEAREKLEKRRAGFFVED